jgi:hypothetical protein
MATAYDYETNSRVPGQCSAALIEASKATANGTGAVLARYDEIDNRLDLVDPSDRQDDDIVVWVDCQTGTY